MNLIERATVIHYHRHRIAAYGEDQVRALGWRAEESQRKRFEVIAGAVDFNHRSVLDLGCGCGDLKTFLDGRFDGVAYLGIDQMPEFIERARRRHAASDSAAFYLGDFSSMAWPQADVVVACGALGYRSADKDFHLRMIRKMVDAARLAVVFNVLDAATFPDHPLLVGRDVERVTSCCRTLSKQVEVIRGYLQDDVTLVIRRETHEDQ